MNMLEINSQTVPSKNLTLGGIVASFVNLTLKGGLDMGKKTKWEYFRAIYLRYRKASMAEKTQILEEFCEVCGYNRKVCHRQTQRSFSSAKNSSQTTPALFPVHLSGPLDPASHLGSIGLPLVGAGKSAPAALAALGQKTLHHLPAHRTTIALDLCTPDRPQTQSQENPAQAAPLRTHQTRYTAQTPYPHQNRLLERHYGWLYRNRSGLSLWQLRERGVCALT